MRKNIFNFFKKRFQNNRLSELPLTLFFISLIYLFLIITGLIKEIINAKVINYNDQIINNLIISERNPTFLKIFYYITSFGQWEIVLIIAIVIISLFIVLEKRTFIFPFIISVTGGELFIYLSKLIFHRARPETAIYQENNFSFPSGHAAIAVSLYGFLTYILSKNVKSSRKQLFFLSVGSLLILAIGFSRLYLGVHYLSDVIIGYLIGLLWLGIGISLIKLLPQKTTKK